MVERLLYGALALGLAFVAYRFLSRPEPFSEDGRKRPERDPRAWAPSSKGLSRAALRELCRLPRWYYWVMGTLIMLMAILLGTVAVLGPA